MAVSYTVDSLIASARRRGQIPQAAGSLDTDDLIALMNEELQTYLVAFIIGLKEEFLVADYDVTLTAGTAEYDLPPRAVGGKLRSVLLLDGDKYRPLARVEPERVLQPPSNTGAPECYYFKGNKVVLDPCGPGTLRMQYFRRPGNLVRAEDAGLITAINTNTREVTVSAAPSTFTSSETYDFIQARPLFETLGMDRSATVSSNTLTFAEALPAGLSVGDYVALAGESPIPQVPLELQSLLARRTTEVAFEAFGTAKDLQMASAMREAAERKAHMLVNDRDESAARYIINRNGPGFRRWLRTAR